MVGWWWWGIKRDHGRVRRGERGFWGLVRWFLLLLFFLVRIKVEMSGAVLQYDGHRSLRVFQTAIGCLNRQRMAT